MRRGNQSIPLEITAGIAFGGTVKPVTMRFRNHGNDIVYCQPDECSLASLESIKAAADLNVRLLYPMSGLELEEPVLQPARIDVLVGEGQTAQVLRNLCLLVAKDSPDSWSRIEAIMNRLYSVKLGIPTENQRGSIDLSFKQQEVRQALDISVAGRGFQQMLLIFVNLFAHKGNVFLMDEPDAHLELLRQKQIYVLLRDIAAENESQVIMVTHSEVILEEARERNQTLLLDGVADQLAKKLDNHSSLQLYGSDHYIRAREHGYVLYVEGSTDVDILRELAKRLDHGLTKDWDERINTYYLRNIHVGQDLDAALERAESGFGLSPKEHFYALKKMLPGLRGLAIRDGDGRSRQDVREDHFEILHWKHYEIENYIVTPGVLLAAVNDAYGAEPEAAEFADRAREIIDDLILMDVFEGQKDRLNAWKSAARPQADLIWTVATERVKLGRFAEQFFERLAHNLDRPVLMRKGEFYRLAAWLDPVQIPTEVHTMLDRLQALLNSQGTVDLSSETSFLNQGKPKLTYQCTCYWQVSAKSHM